MTTQKLDLKMQLRWGNLKNSRCPKCNNKLLASMTRPFLRCSGTKSKRCDFYIGKQRMQEIVAEQVKREIQEHQICETCGGAGENEDGRKCPDCTFEDFSSGTNVIE